MPIRKSVTDRKPSLHAIAQMGWSEGRNALWHHYQQGPNPRYEEQSEALISEYEKAHKPDRNDPAMILIEKLHGLFKGADAMIDELEDELEPTRIKR